MTFNGNLNIFYRSVLRAPNPYPNPETGSATLPRSDSMEPTSCSRSLKSVVRNSSTFLLSQEENSNLYRGTNSSLRLDILPHTHFLNFDFLPKIFLSSSLDILTNSLNKKDVSPDFPFSMLYSSLQTCYYHPSSKNHSVNMVMRRDIPCC